MRKLVNGLVLVVAVMILVGCGGKSGNSHKTSTSTPSGGGVPPTAVPTPTLRPPAPRNRPLPQGEPSAFEAPFSVGTFVRQSMDGRAISTQTGGLRATYLQDKSTIVVTVYRFSDQEQASKTVEFALSSGSAAQTVTPLYAAPSIAFGVVQDKHGGYLAAWSHKEWCFLVATSDSLDVLNTFLESFPY